MNQTPAKSTDWLDGAAIGLSGLCLLHCLALPFLVGVLPLLMPFAESHLHAQMLYFAVPLSIIAVGIGYARHRSARVVVAAAAGLALLIVGATVAHGSLGVVAACSRSAAQSSSRLHTSGTACCPAGTPASASATERIRKLRVVTTFRDGSRVRKIRAQRTKTRIDRPQQVTATHCHRDRRPERDRSRSHPTGDIGRCALPPATNP